MPPKRKRNAEPTLQDKLEKHHNEISKALKASKGFERQRMSKRIHEAGITPEKQERIEREIAVLKSIDLHQTALAHLYSSLLKIKAIAASTDLPDEIRVGIPKPELSEEEKIALHNVTSGLYNRPLVKQAVEKAISSVCGFLNVPVPGKAKRVRKKDLEKDDGEQPADRISALSLDGDVVGKIVDEGKHDEGQDGVEDDDDATDFEGFGSDLDEADVAAGESGDDDDDHDGDNNEHDEEKDFALYDGLLGSSDHSDDESDQNYDPYARFRGTETVNLDDISLSGSADEAQDDSDPEDMDESASESGSLSSSSSASLPPAKKTKKTERRVAGTDGGPVKDSTFLPSLMGGYVSGSESASDVDVAAPKKRRGQRARQAIWEKKFGAKALHLKKQKSGRDAGWDMKRGAVDGDDGQGRRTPWKKGVSNPLLRRNKDNSGSSSSSNNNTRGGEQGPAPPPRITKRDDQGKLHASWEAAKKAKEQKAATFSGSKITFD